MNGENTSIVVDLLAMANRKNVSEKSHSHILLGRNTLHIRILLNYENQDVLAQINAQRWRKTSHAQSNNKSNSRTKQLKKLNILCRKVRPRPCLMANIQFALKFYDHLSKQIRMKKKTMTTTTTDVYT